MSEIIVCELTAAACPLGQVIGDGCQVADPTAGYSFDLTQLSKARPVKGKDYFATRDSGSEYEYQIKVTMQFCI